MKRILVVFLCLTMLIITGSVSVVVAEDGAYFSIGDYNESVIALHQKLSDLGYYSLRPESPWGPSSVRALKILEENVGAVVEGLVSSQQEYDEIMSLENVVGKNLAVDTSTEWSDWITPAPNLENKGSLLAYALLSDGKTVGDYYTCSFEVEFKGVTATEGQKWRFLTHGPVDDTWDIPNIWNTKFVNLFDVPEDGVYRYTGISQITEENVNATKFALRVRYDFWASGSFRVRNIKVEKGSKATEWCE